MKRFLNIGSRIKKLSISQESNFLSGSVLFILLILWEMVTRGGLYPPHILPAPTSVLYSLVTTFHEIWEHIVITVYEAMIGFFIAMAMAVVLAVIMDCSKVIRQVLYPMVITSQTVPLIVLAPLFAIWFGFGYLPKVIVVILVCFFPITVSLLEGLASVDQELLNLLRAMGANRLQIYKIVKFPAAMPNFFSGLKISATYSIMGAIIGEWNGGKKGLGIYMSRARYSFAVDKVFVAIVIITLLSILLLKVISMLERKLMPWNEEEKENQEEEFKYEKVDC